MKKLLFIIIVFAFVSCQSGNKSNNTESVAEPVEVVETTINISGMHCDNCVVSVEKGINGLEGIASVSVSLSDSTAIVKYDKSKLELADIEKSIEKRGYTVK
ncbi:cation transporter [Draconibacterium sp.]|nr:cation transporter [Draconibacterium sp.]